MAMAEHSGELRFSGISTGFLSTAIKACGSLKPEAQLSGFLSTGARITGRISTKCVLRGELSGSIRYIEIPGPGGELSHITVRSGKATFVEGPASGFYGIGSVTVEGDEDLKAENIKEGVNILGVDGSFKGGELQEVSVRSTFQRYGVEPDSGYYGIGKVVVETDPNLKAENIRKGAKVFDVAGTYAPRLTTKTATITGNGSYPYAPDSNYDGYSKVTVTVNVPQEIVEVKADLRELYVTPGYSDKTYNKQNATDFDGYDYVKVYGDTDLIAENIRAGKTIFGVTGTYEKTEVVEARLQDVSVTPDKFPDTVFPDYDEGWHGLSSVTINADSNFKASNIKENVKMFGVTGTYKATPKLQSFTRKLRTTDSFPYTVTPDSGYDGVLSGTLTKPDNLIPGNIKSGQTVLGVTGNYVGEELNTQERSITPAYFPYPVTPTETYNGMSKVTVNADANFNAANIRSGVKMFGVTGTYESKLQVGSAIAGLSGYNLIPDEPGAMGFSTVYVEPVSLELLDLTNLDEVKF